MASSLRQSASLATLESASEREQRLVWERARLTEGEADIAAGQVILDEDLDAWLDAWVSDTSMR